MMNTWNYKMYCVHEELSRKAVDYIVNDRTNGWQILHSAILIESIVSENLSRLLRRRRLEMMSYPQPDKLTIFIRHLAKDLNTVDEILKELAAEMAPQENAVCNNEELLQGVL